MADLSAVLRKTIDGLPNATPELRARVYDKARAAILRQIENANPPLSDDDVAVRRDALERAIEATEAHYAEGEGESAQPPTPEPAPVPSAAAAAAAPQRPAPPAAPEAPAARPAWARRNEEQPPQPSPPREAEDAPRMPRADANFAARPAAERATPRPPSVEGGPRRAIPDGDRRDERFEPAATEPEGGFDIPDADISAPRYSGGARRPRKSRGPLLAGVAAVIVIAALGTGGYLYRDELAGMLGSGDAQTAGNAAPTTTPNGAAGSGGGTTRGGDVAALPPATNGGGQSATPPATGTGNTTEPSPKRRFTQRLMPDGSESDAGPGPSNANAFDEGTNIAAATPEPTQIAPPAGSPPATPPAGGATPPAATNNGATPPPSQPTQAPPPSNNAAVPAVAQKAMFYEERTATLQGTQQTGSVVWSKVSEPPAEGQPPEPAIRAVASVPAENFRMTMTIRRNLDPTLPASHVIELQFDVPPGFAGGQVANVQRLALKPSEEARGEPLIGVAGKISDGFFIIALNNLDKATETNLGLLGRQEWIDIPIAYATGRRALMSIEKGVPGDRVFKETLDAWAAAKT
ncbi:hypothetical protein [Aureimonas leprariae]|uniref:Uncharacterized protein n=1 Tax=Plantimonas leprariae TaxID=2615207 RepID=A0A7V7TYW0_9HYPH|nr:hypothetical protein [Aureimonas leprariae]KAB0678033.1 hypothetical protein F6X38_16525 [Aureimonas leprariae]